MKSYEEIQYIKLYIMLATHTVINLGGQRRQRPLPLIQFSLGPTQLGQLLLGLSRSLSAPAPGELFLYLSHLPGELEKGVFHVVTGRE